MLSSRVGVMSGSPKWPVVSDLIHKWRNLSWGRLTPVQSGWLESLTCAGRGEPSGSFLNSTDMAPQLGGCFKWASVEWKVTWFINKKRLAEVILILPFVDGLNTFHVLAWGSPWGHSQIALAHQLGRCFKWQV